MLSAPSTIANSSAITLRPAFRRAWPVAPQPHRTPPTPRSPTAPRASQPAPPSVQHGPLVVELDPQAVKSDPLVTMHHEDDLPPRRPQLRQSAVKALHGRMGFSTHAERHPHSHARPGTMPDRQRRLEGISEPLAPPAAARVVRHRRPSTPGGRSGGRQRLFRQPLWSFAPHTSLLSRAYWLSSGGSSGIGLATACQHRGKASHWIRAGTRKRSAHPKVLSSG